MAFEFTLPEIVELWARFNAFDQDKSGALTKSEWENVISGSFSKYGKFTPQMFEIADLQGDGNIEFNEFIRLVGEMAKRQASKQVAARQLTEPSLNWRDVWDAFEIFLLMDENRSGSVSEEELRRALPKTATGDQDVTRILQELDVNKSGKIGFEEFLRGVALGYVVVSNRKQNRPAGQSRYIHRSPAVVAVASTAANTKASAPPASPISTLSDADRAAAFKAFISGDKDGSGTITIDEFEHLLKGLKPGILPPEINRIYGEMDTDHSGQITFDEFLLGFRQLQLDIGSLNLGPRPSPKLYERGGVEYEWEIPFEELTLGTQIGEGTFGVVYRGTWRGTTVAIKKLKEQALAEEVLRDFRHEVSLMGKMRHPHTVLFMGACTRPPNLCIVTEFMDGGSIFDLMHKRKIKFNKKQIVRIALHVARGLNYLHLGHPPIVHRDLKSLNLLVDVASPAPTQVKLADFGLSCIKEASSLREICGTPAFMAPELLNEKPYNEKVDVYGFAMCLWELVTGEFPFAELDYEQLKRNVLRYQKRPPLPPTVDPELAALITSCWQNEVAKRPSVNDIINLLERMRF